MRDFIDPLLQVDRPLASAQAPVAGELTGSGGCRNERNRRKPRNLKRQVSYVEIAEGNDAGAEGRARPAKAAEKKLAGTGSLRGSLCESGSTNKAPEETVTRSRAADDFATIRKRVEELRRERARLRSTAAR
jgi:hypothetical protein